MIAKKEEATALLDSDFSSDSDSVFGDEDGITQVCVRMCVYVYVSPKQPPDPLYNWQQQGLN